MKRFELGWGEPEVIKEALNSVYDLNFKKSISQSKYPPHTGTNSLKEKIAQFLLEQTGLKYPLDNIFITIGATGAINACLMVYKQINPDAKSVITNTLYFGFYPGIIKNCGYNHVTFGKADVCIQDSPSNPEGIKVNLDASFKIWDAVYFSPTYISGNMARFIPEYDVLIGSASKLMGLSGERIGWIAVRSMSQYEKYIPIFSDVVTHLFCGANWMGQHIVEKHFPIYDNNGDAFFKKSRKFLNDNKEEWGKLKHLFDGTIPQDVGMFFLSEIDSAAKRLLDDCGIGYKYGYELGVGGENKIRINLAASKTVIFQAVKEILKKDKK